MLNLKMGDFVTSKHAPSQVMTVVAVGKDVIVDDSVHDLVSCTWFETVRAEPNYVFGQVRAKSGEFLASDLNLMIHVPIHKRPLDQSSAAKKAV